MLALAMLPLTGCLSFRAVSAAGTLGQRVGEHRTSFDDLHNICLEAVAVGGPSIEGCESIRPARTNVVAGMGAITAYGGALRTLAEAEDPDVEDNVTAAIEAMPFESLSGEADSVGGLISTLLSQSYRRDQLREIIDRAEPTISALAQSLESVMAGWMDMLRELYDVALRELGRLPIEDGRVGRMALATAAGHAADELVEIEAATLAIRGFAAAHRELRQSGDLSTTETLIAVVEAAFAVGGSAADVVSSGGVEESPEEPDSTEGQE